MKCVKEDQDPGLYFPVLTKRTRLIRSYYFFHQILFKSTRGQNILDLVFTTVPGFLSGVNPLHSRKQNVLVNFLMK